MTCRVDFCQPDRALSVAHSINYANGLSNIKLNAEKIAGSGYFAKEPRRLSFDCWPDEWLSANLLNATGELPNQVSPWRVRFYIDNTLRFTGIIDTSHTSYNAADDTLCLTCYDYLHLLSKYSDNKLLYAQHAGYTPSHLFALAWQGVESTISNYFTVPYSSSYTPLSLPVQNLDILTIPWQDILFKFANYNNIQIAAGFLWATSYSGHSLPEFRLVVHSINYATYPELNRYGRVWAKKWRFFNKISWAEVENSELDEEYTAENTGDLVNWRDETLADYDMNSGWGTMHTFGYDGCAYRIPLEASDFSHLTCAPTKPVTVSGNCLPGQIYPKGLYELQNEPQERLRVLKAMLLLHNLTIVSQASGAVTLTNKNESASQVIPLDKADIVAFKLSRQNREQPDLATLDCLLGDLTVLKAQLSAYYAACSAAWELTATLDNPAKYNLSLFDRVSINGKTYLVSELTRDYDKDEYQLKAWEV